MASTDNVVINTRERPLSTDINNLQSMLGRTLLDVLQGLTAARAYSGAANPTETTRDVVLRGLLVTPSGEDVSISAGVLLQLSASLAPTPSSLDSAYRVGVLRAAATEVAPVPGGDTYYLLQAQMTEVTTVSSSRDVFDTGTGQFVATLVDKQKERRITFAFKAGTSTQAPAADTDYVPIAIVFRPGGGGDVLTSHIHDVRPLANQGATIQTAHATMVTSRQLTIGDATTHSGAQAQRLNLEAWLGGDRLFAFAPAAFDITDAQYNEAGLSYPTGAEEMLYVYLGRINGYAPSGLYSDLSHRGILVISRVEPNVLTNLNGGAISLPAPFSGLSIAAGGAVCVGALMTLFAGDLRPQSIGSDGTHIIHRSTGSTIPAVGVQFDTITTNQDIDFDTEAAAGGEHIPKNATTMILKLNVGGGSGNAITFTVKINSSGGQTYYNATVAQVEASNLTFELPRVLSNVWNFDLPLSGGTPTADLRILGWRY